MVDATPAQPLSIGYPSNDDRTQDEMKTFFEAVITALRRLPGGAPDASFELSTEEATITPNTSIGLVQDADTINKIGTNNFVLGSQITLVNKSGSELTFGHRSDITVAGYITAADAVDVTVTAEHSVVFALFQDTSGVQYWQQVIGG